MPALVHAVKHALLFQVGKQFHEVFLAEHLPFFKGQLECRTLYVMEQYQKVVRVDPAVLGRACKEIVGVFHDELVHGIALCNQDREALPCPAARPACLLPGAGDRARIADHDACLQIADIDAELEGVCAHNPHDAFLAQAFFDLPPQVGQIPAPVARHVMVVRYSSPEHVLEVLGQDLHVEPARREGDGLYPVADKVVHHVAGGGQG